MKKAIILHGMPNREEYFNPKNNSQSNSHWLPWLQQQLLVNNILTQTPEMPAPYAPNYADWKKEFEQFQLDENTMLIGHSLGAGFLIKYLSENNLKINKLALVAPFINSAKAFKEMEFFEDFVIDQALLSRTSESALFISRDDDTFILQDYLELKEKLLGLEIFGFQDKGHFTFEDMGTQEFPELLKYLLN